MATLVTFHAHPDDEAIGTGGTMAKAAGEGHRVVLVVATKGEHGEVAPGFLGSGEELWERRTKETHEAARILGVARVEFLGYVDSGMMGTDTNGHLDSFWKADVDEAAGRLASILEEERADVLTIYDANGGYGHPDHIQVHRVGSRAAAVAGTQRVYEVTFNRDHFRRGIELLAGSGIDVPRLEEDSSFGTPEEQITTSVDVSEYLEQKRRAMVAHASQIGEESFFLKLPPPAFAFGFGTEWYVRHDRRLPTLSETTILPQEAT